MRNASRLLFLLWSQVGVQEPAGFLSVSLSVAVIAPNTRICSNCFSPPAASTQAANRGCLIDIGLTDEVSDYCPCLARHLRCRLANDRGLVFTHRDDFDFSPSESATKEGAISKMERKLKEIMDNCDLNVFELINLAIQVASHLYPAELALRRDRIIEQLYNSSDVTGQDAAMVSGKKARVSTKGGVGSSRRPITGQLQGLKQKRSTDAKGKLELSEKRRCARNYTLKIGEIEPQPVPVGTIQGQSSVATKGKGKIPYTESVPRHAEGSNMRNNQVQSNNLKGKSIAPVPAEKVQKHAGINCNKTLTIGGGEVAQKINTTSGGCQGRSSQHDNRDEQDITSIDDDLMTISKGKEKAEDPLDWWVDKNDSSSSDDV